MPTPNTELNSDIKISTAPMNVESNEDDVSDIILMNSSDANIDTFTTLPLDFDSSNSSIGTMESITIESMTMDSIDDPTKIDSSSLPVLTDIAEETVYETKLFEETLKLEESSLEARFSDTNSCLEEQHDISNILMDTSVLKTGENATDGHVFQDSLNDIHMKNELVEEELLISDVTDCNTNNSGAAGNKNDLFLPVSFSTASTSEVSSLITVSNNTNLVSGILENAALNNVSSDNLSNINVDLLPNSLKNNVYTNLSNVIQVNSVNNKKLPTYKPIAIQSTPKFIPISIAPNPAKRSANMSIGPQGSNIVTKVIVSQGKMGQPILITNSPSNKQKPICVLPNTTSGSSPVKSITAAQAMQMGIKLQPIRPSTTKPFKQNLVLSNVHPGTPVLQKVQQFPKSTPTKILPAPLVSKSSTGSQPQKIILRSDYVMKAGSIIPKQSGGQMITISNLQSSPLVSNHSSPKKQVQYIKLINNVGSTNMPTVTTAKGKTVTVPQTAIVTKIDKDTPIIVASSNFSASNLNMKGINSVATSKPSSATGIAVTPAVPSSTAKTTPGQRLILPAVAKTKSEGIQSLFAGIDQMKPPSGSIVVLPDNVLEKLTGELLSTPVKLKEDVGKISQENLENTSDSRGAAKSPSKSAVLFSFESGNGLKSRKPCNCTRSQCLKLYCECFANGEFCNNCNCVSCHNNISHEENRQNAIRSCLDRNPQAFRPKIGKCVVGQSDRRHTKGCHCKRSGCLKNYCECYEAQIPCSDNCKCIGCKNIDDMLFATSCSSSNHDKSDQPFEFQTFSKNKLTAEINDAVGQSGSTNPRHAFSFIKDQVVEATCQCLLAQAEDVKRRNVNVEDGKKYILEEFGRCLIQIIECAPDKYVPS